MLTFAVDGADKAIVNLARIQDPQIRQRILKRAARQVIKSSRDRVSTQVDIDGKPFGNYSDKTIHTRPRRRKMLARLASRLAFINVDDFSVTVGWKNSRDEGIAAKHQFGDTMRFQKSWMNAELDGTRKGMAYYKDPATRRQAKALLESGYKVRRAKGGLWTPSIKWITDNLSIAKAGLILKILRGGAGMDEWTIKTPARPFLGVTADDIEVLMAAINDEYAKAMNQGAVS